MADPQEVQTQTGTVPAVQPVVAEGGGNVTVTTPQTETGNVTAPVAEGGNTTRDARGEIPPSVMRRIDELATDKRTLTQKLADAEARLAALQNPPGNVTTIQRQTTDAELEYRAAQIAAKREFDTSCAKVYDQGAKDFPDWQNSVGMLQRMTGQAIIPIVEAALEVGETSKVLYELGKNPEEAARIANLPPARQAAAVAKFASSVGKPAAVSKAAEPITTLVGGGGNKGEERLDNEKLSMKDWMALRNKQVAGGKR